MLAQSLQRLGAVVSMAVLIAACTGDSEQKLLDSARAYMAKSNYNAAVIELKRALGKNAASGATRFLLGRALLEAGDPAAAEVELNKALEDGATQEQVFPLLARGLLLLAQPAKVVAQFGTVNLRDAVAEAELRTWVAAAYAQQGNLDRANEQLAAALRSQPLHATAVMVQARLKAAAGDVDGALQMLDAVLAQEPANEHVGVAKGYLLWLGKNDAPGALAAHRKVLAAKPATAAAQAEIVAILFSQGKAAEARQQFELLKKMAPNHPETLFFEAQFAYVDKQYARSREMTDTVLKAVPNHVRALELAAAAEYHLGNDELVQSFVGRALKVAPSLKLSRQILAQSMLRSGEPAKALAVLAPLLDGDSADAESLVLAGTAYLQVGKVKQADGAFKKAGQLSPDSAKVRTEVAMALMSGGSSDVALRDLEAVAAGDQGPRADLALISARIAQQDYRGALKAIDGLQAKMQSLPLPYLLRGQVLVSLRDAAGARRSFELALGKDAKYFPAVAALASMDVAMGKADLGRKRLTDFLKVVPTSGQAMALLAEIPSAAGGPAEDALQRMADAARANPMDRKAHLALVARHLQAGDRASALAAAQTAFAALPNDMAVLEALGQAQLLAGDAQQAITTFRKLTGLQPNSAQAQVNLAEALVTTKDHEAAGRALQRAVEIDPMAGQARRGLAMLALRDNRHAEALAMAREMQKLQPQSALGYAVEGDIETQRKNWPAAATAYQSAMHRSSASEAAIKLHVVLGASGKSADADRLAAAWEEKRPNDPPFRFYLGDVATQRKDYAAAEAHYRAVLVTQPNNALAMNNIAWLLHQQSKPGALDMANKANSLLPNRAPILDTLASILAASGKVPQAIAAQRKAIANSPQDPNLKLNLARYLIKDDKKGDARDQLEALARLGPGFGKQTEVASLLKTL